MKIKSNKVPKPDKLYLGIDQSLTCTALCLMDSEGLVIERIKPLYMGVSRLSEIAKVFEDFLDATDRPIAGAAIEGYAYSAKGAVFNLGELGGVLRLVLYRRGIPTVEVPPTYLKKYLTGKGNSPKNVMLKEAFRKYEVDLNDDNDCDAFALSLVAHDYFE